MSYLDNQWLTHEDCASPKSGGIIWCISFRLGEREDMAQKEKTVSYRRATWLSEHEGSINLAGCIKLALTKLLDVNARTFLRDNGQVMTLAKYQPDSHGGYYLHITAETPGEPASILPKRRRAKDEIEVGTAAPPSDSEFMDGDAFVYVRGNDVCLCGTAMQDSTVRYFLQELFKLAKIRQDATQFDRMHPAKAAGS